MPIDPNIALSFKPSVALADPVDMYAKHQQIQANALAMQKYQTEATEKNALAKLIGAPNYNPYDPQSQAAAFKVAPNLAPALFKNLTETRTAGVDYDTKTQALETARRNETNAKKLDAVKQIVSHNTVDSVKSDVNRRVAAGELDQAHADAILSSLPQTDEGMPSWKNQTLHTLLTPQEQLEQTTTTQNLGNISRTTVRPKFAGGSAPAVTDATINLSPDAASAAATAKAGQGVTIRGQNMTAETARLAREVAAGRLTPQTNAAGDINFFDIKGNLVKTVPGAGKPSATFEKTKILRQNAVKDLDIAITQLEAAVKPNGLIDQATGSGAGALRDKGAAFVGQSTKGAVAIGALQPVYDLVLKMVPRFQGAQSDKDVASYNRAAGDLANPNVTKDVKKAAAQTILKIMKARKGQFISQEEAAGGGVVGEAPSGGGWGSASVVNEE